MRHITVFLLITLCIVFFGCAKKADETRSLSEIQAEAEGMNVSQLKSMAAKYRDAIVAKKDDITKFTSKLKDIPVTDLLDTEAKELKAEIDALSKSVSALKARFDVYYEKLKAAGGDTSGLEL